MRFALENQHIAPGRTATVGELLERGEQRFSHWRDRSVALHAPDPFTLLEAMLAAGTVGFELAIMPEAPGSNAWSERVVSSVHTVATEGDGRLTELAGAARRPAEPPGLTLFTSGSTGEPKRVHHPFERLDTFVNRDPAPRRWLVTYLPGTYAWTQMVVLGLVALGQTLVFPASLDAADVLTALTEHEVTAVSSTPTFWRYLLTTLGQEELQGRSLEQITLGGERADQAILDVLRMTFPGARITHVFATTEAGPAFAVTDGRAGFPRGYLERGVLGGRVSLKIERGTLWVRSPYTERGDDAWVDTGDLAEVVGDRVHIRGRRQHDILNVGGAKVARAQLEDFVRSLDGVSWARVYPERAPVVGTVVGLEVVVDQGRWADHEEAEAAIVQACLAKFPEHYLPRVVRFLDGVPLGKALKTRV